LHAVACAVAAQRQEILEQHVLAKRGRIVYCAVIRGAWVSPDGKECWTLETLWPEKARLTIPVRNVIQCGGEFCSCAPDRASEAPHEAGAQKGLTC
jgi:hypothetical protein